MTDATYAHFRDGFTKRMRAYTRPYVRLDFDLSHGWKCPMTEHKHFSADVMRTLWSQPWLVLEPESKHLLIGPFKTMRCAKWLAAQGAAAWDLAEKNSISALERMASSDQQYSHLDILEKDLT